MMIGDIVIIDDPREGPKVIGMVTADRRQCGDGRNLLGISELGGAWIGHFHPDQLMPAATPKALALAYYAVSSGITDPFQAADWVELKGVSRSDTHDAFRKMIDAGVLKHDDHGLLHCVAPHET